MLSAEISENKGMQKLRTCIVLTFNTLLFSVCSISLVASIMFSIYAKLSSHVLAIREKEQVFTLARLKIVPTIKNMICRCLLYDCEM